MQVNIQPVTQNQCGDHRLSLGFASGDGEADREEDVGAVTQKHADHQAPKTTSTSGFTRRTARALADSDDPRHTAAAAVERQTRVYL